MPQMTPVGNTIQPVNPGQGLATLSSILGLQSKQIGIAQQAQNLQTGALAQQQQAAETKQAEQRNSELQALATFTSNAAKDPSYLNADGTPNVARYQQGAMAVAPTYGEQYIGQMTSNFNEAVSNRKAILSLGSAEQQQIAQRLQSVAQNPNASKSDLLNAVEQARSVDSDPAYQRMIDGALMSFPQVEGMPTAQAAQTIRGWAAKTAAAMGGPALAAPTTISTGGAIQPGVQNPYSGQFTPSGAAIPTTLPPQVVMTPARTLGTVGGAGGNVIRTLPVNGSHAARNNRNAAPPGPGLNSPSWVMQNANQLSQDDAQRYQLVSQEGLKAQTGYQLTQQVADLAQQVRTGKFTKQAADALTVLRQSDPGATYRQLLEKYAEQVKTMATDSATTDAERSQIDSGMPNPATMSPQAIEQAAQYVGGIFQMRGARQAYADAYVKRNGSALGLRQVDDSFMQSADPLVFAYNSLPAGEARQAFLADHFGKNADQIRAFVARDKQVKHYVSSIQ